MLFYLLIIPSSVVLVIILIDLQRRRKHDKILFALYQIRRDIMSFLFREGSSLSKADYVAVRMLLDKTNNIIDHFGRL